MRAVRQFIFIVALVLSAIAIEASPLAAVVHFQSPVATPSVAAGPLPTATSTVTLEAGGAVPLLLVGIVVGLILGVVVVLIVRRAAPNER
jgi:hypothetical protein